MSTAQPSEADTKERRGYSVDEVARMYGLSRNKVYDAIALGSLHSFKIGKRRVIPVAALEAWESGAHA